VGGGDLFEHVTRWTRFPEEMGALYAAEVALGLDHIHRNGYLYRDLKLENVLISTNGHAKLGDFGLARKHEGGRDEKHTMAGTPSHMAPEVLNMEVYGSPVDWWGLGIVFLEMVLGYSPFPHPAYGFPLADILRYFEGGQHFEKLLQTGISHNLYECISEMLVYQPANRIAGIERLKQMRLYASYDWDALLALKVKAPLASYFEEQMREQDGKMATPAISASSYGLKVGELAAVERRFSEVGTFMEQFGSVVSISREEATSTLIEAAAKGDVRTMRSVAEGTVVGGLHPNVCDYDQRTAIHLASSNGKLEAVQFLIEEMHSAHSPKDRWGGTPLDDAIRHSHLPLIEYLTSKGAVRGGRAIDTSATACCTAAASGDVEVLRAIQKAGGKVNAGDYDRRTPMHLAASENRIDVVRFLVDECGVDPSPEDRWGGTPLDDASRSGHEAMRNYLESVGGRSGAPQPAARQGLPHSMEEQRRSAGKYFSFSQRWRKLAPSTS